MDAWDLYFASLVGWLLHPGYLRPGTSRPDLNELADLADEMVDIRNGRMDRRSCRDRR